MANDCCTTYICVGDKHEVDDLHDLLKREFKENSWIYSLVSKYIGEEKANKMRLRGEIMGFHIDEEDGYLTIVQDTAWCEQEGFREWIETRYPSIKVYFAEEEPGCEIYTTNDSSGLYFPNRYVLDKFDGTDYYLTLDDVAEYLSEVTGTPVEPTIDAINQVTNKFNDAHEDEDEYIYFHEVAIIDD